MELAKRFLNDRSLNAAWAERYGSEGDFEVVLGFLQESVRAGEESRHHASILESQRARGPRDKIFISYRREDSGHATYDIYKRLVEKFGIDRVFFDITSIPMGVNFQEYIQGNVQGSAVLLAVIGDHWLESRNKSGPREGERRIDDPEDYVRFEIELALKAKLRIIPVLVGSQSMPSAAQLPPCLAQLAMRNAAALHFGPEFESRCDSLIAEIQAELPRALLVRKVSAWLDSIFRINRAK